MVIDEEPSADSLRRVLRARIDAQLNVEKPARDFAHKELDRMTDAEVRDYWFMASPEEIVETLLAETDKPGEIYFLPGGDLDESF
jgi:hypothetical protein